MDVVQGMLSILQSNKVYVYVDYKPPHPTKEIISGKGIKNIEIPLVDFKVIITSANNTFDPGP
jgi:hypothetical protein